MNGGDGDGGGGAAVAPAPPLEWKFSQVFGERAAGEEVQEGKRNYSEIRSVSAFFSYLLLRH